MKIAVLKPNESPQFHDVAGNHYEWMRDQVGGFLEIIPWWPTTLDIAYVDEDGQMKQPRLPHNPLASMLARTVIVGTMVVVGSTNRGAEWRDLSDDAENEIKSQEIALRTARYGV